MTARRTRALARVIVLAMALSAGCGGKSSDQKSDGPLDAEITAAINAFWKGTGVADGVAQVFGYDHQTHKSTGKCQHLPEADRWYAERTSIVEPGKVTQSAMTQATPAYLEREGFTVSRWRTSATDAPIGYGFIGHKADTAIGVDISADGRTDLTVRMGPCGRSGRCARRRRCRLRSPCQPCDR